MYAAGSQGFKDGLIGGNLNRGADFLKAYRECCVGCIRMRIDAKTFKVNSTRWPVT